MSSSSGTTTTGGNTNPVANVATTSTSTSAPVTTTTTPWMPPMPIMGAIEQVGKDEYSAWTGGLPKADWSGLDPTALTVPVTPNQFRPALISSSQKGHIYRQTGLKTKFSRQGDLTTFEHNVWTHLVDTGMDTTAYVPDPVDPTRMINSVKEHGRFSVETITKQIKAQLLKYDTYSQMSDRESSQFLLDSLEPDLAREVRDVMDPGEAFPITYLRLIQIIRSTSIDRFEHLKNRIKSRKPHQYPGQDLSKMASDLRADARELEIAGQFNHNLTLHMLDAFLEGGGSNNEDYRFPLRGLKDKLSRGLLEIGYMSPAAATKHMADNGLTYKHICTAAVDQYRTQLDNNKWPPARSISDPKAPPKTFGNAAVCSVDPTVVAQVYALIQKQEGSGGSAKPNDECLHCGQKGHWARDCPTKKDKNNKGHRRNGNGKSNRKPGGNRPNGQPNWKKVAPKPGEPTTKAIDGKTWRWCAKCDRWSTTHGTNQHTGSTTPAPAPAQAHTAYESPAAWNVPFLLNPTPWDILLIAATLPCLFWTVLLRIIHFLLQVLCRDTFRVLVATALGFTFGRLPDDFFDFSCRLFSAHWHNLLAPTCWLLCLVISFLGPSFILYLANLNKPPNLFVAGRPPSRTNSPTRHRSLCRKLRRRTLVSKPHSKHRIPHYGLKQKLSTRLPLHERHRPQLYSALANLEAFATAISFRRVRREGEGWSRKRSKTMRPHNHCAKYCPLSPFGLTTTQARLLSSPVAKAYFMHATLLTDNPIQALKAALLSPPETNEVIGKEHRFPVIWDSGASTSISHSQNDFVGPLEPAPIGIKLQGIARGLSIKGIGHVAWSFVDNTGMLRTLKVPAYYVPGARARLLSTNSLLKEFPNETIQQLPDRLLLSGNKESGVNGIEILVDPRTNLHIGLSYDSTAPQTVCSAFATAITTTSIHNANLGPAEKELLRWHFRLGHLSFKKVQFLMQSGVLAHSEATRRLHTTATKLQSCPLCAACQYGKQRRRPTPGKRSQIVKDRDGILKRDNLFPGQKVSVDHFICSTRGRLQHTYGKEDPKQQYSGGAIFVDHASGYIFIKEQVHMNTHETIASKEAFEAHCRDYGVIPTEYLSDNGPSLSSQAYREHLMSFAQISQYAGVGAHHHNGIAERAIQTVMSIARTMMLHSAIHWPDVADAALWPMAVAHAVRLYNHVPNPSNGLSPHDVFSKSRWSQSKFHDLHVWGCPVYVLDKKITDGSKLPRWKARSTRQVYVGMSDKHSSSVPLCLNLETGAITPQFHIVFDDDFATVTSKIEDLPNFDSPAWQELFGDSSYQFVLNDDDQAAVDVLDLTTDEPPERQHKVAAAFDQLRPSQPLPTSPPTSPPAQVTMPSSTPLTTHSPPGGLSLSPEVTKDLPLTLGPSLLPTTVPPTASAPSGRVNESLPSTLPPPSPAPSHQRENIGATGTSSPSFHVEPPNQQREQSPVSKPRAPTTAPATQEPRRSARIRSAPNRLGYDGSQGSGYFSVCHHFLASISLPDSLIAAYKARAVKDPDTLTWDEAIKSSNKAEWLSAAQKEITQLEQKGTWDEVPISDAKTKIVPGTWVFRVKRNPSGEIKKFKARFCVRGDLEEDDGSDNYAPVASWSTVRLFLVFCLLAGWTTASIDFSNAFVQSTLDSPVWIHLPRGYISPRGPGTCLRLKKSLYGLRIAPKLWAKTCINGFKQLGFVQSEFDSCLLYRKGMIVVLYVDDAGIGAANPKDIDNLIDELHGLGFELQKEGDFTEFLGIKFEHHKDGSIELTQRGLIDKILTATNMVDCNPNTLPASTPLGSDPDGLPMSESWNYPSIIGMLLYLSTNTRCDIAFAVSQVARFSANPKQSHATAVKSIVRYLQRTKEQGMIIRPTGKMDLDLYVDADFCGLFKKEVDSNADAARSRTGYVVLLSGCPLVWKSQLQASIACSTLEAEYTALSYALKVLLPIKRTLHEALSMLDIPPSFRTTVRARVFEDNQGAYYLAVNHRITNRTRYFLNKWHWFWDHANEFEIYKIDSRNQRADYFTKPLPCELFDNNRLLVQGW